LSDTLLKANFHAHGRAWAGLTWGENPDEEVIDAYAAKGYDVPAISNYFKITGEDKFPEPLIYIPAYEHGFNLRKVHCLCIGAQKISTTEFPSYFNDDLTNHMIRSLRKNCDLVALAHPGARHAHVPGDMKDLTGLQLMEVANTQGPRTEFWDSTLSAGQPVWFLANDDMHGLNEKHPFMRWNMIFARRPDRTSVKEAMRDGHHYGVVSYDVLCEDNRLTGVVLKDDTLRITTRDTFNRLDIIGQDGVSRYTVSRSVSAECVLLPSDTYLRAEIHHDHCVMYLNPLLRYDGTELPWEKSIVYVVNQRETWLVRIALSAILLMIVVGWFRWMRNKV
jgi:hypothetical protein